MSSCKYCEYFYGQTPIKSSLSKGSTPKRRCKIAKKIIVEDSKICKYFNPTFSFWCEKFKQKLNPIYCLIRRLNKKSFDNWKPCKKCRQFDKEIRPLIEDHFLELQKIIPPPNNPENKEKRKIKRRKGNNRTLKRRKPKSSKRLLKRRKNA